jgi:hypothetical protein
LEVWGAYPYNPRASATVSYMAAGCFGSFVALAIYTLEHQPIDVIYEMMVYILTPMFLVWCLAMAAVPFFRKVGI